MPSYQAYSAFRRNTRGLMYVTSALNDVCHGDS